MLPVFYHIFRVNHIFWRKNIICLRFFVGISGLQTRVIQNRIYNRIIQPAEQIFLVKSAMYQLISEVYDDELTDEIKEAVEFFIYGCIGFMEYHLLTDNILPVDVTVLLFERCMPEILKKYI